MKPARVLVIDDEPLVRWSLGEKLSDWGFVVECAATGEEGLRFFGERRHDVVLLDVLMPGLSGMEVLRRLRGLSPAVPVVIVTACDSAETQRSLLGEGARGFLPKPFEFRELKAVLEAALDATA